MPEPPYEGCIYQAVRSRSGRRWRVERYDKRWGWHLHPIGGSSSGGGVKAIWRTTPELRDLRRWKCIS